MMWTELRDALRALRLHAALSLSDACRRCWLLSSWSAGWRWRQEPLDRLFCMKTEGRLFCMKTEGREECTGFLMYVAAREGAAEGFRRDVQACGRRLRHNKCCFSVETRLP